MAKEEKPAIISQEEKEGSSFFFYVLMALTGVLLIGFVGFMIYLIVTS